MSEDIYPVFDKLVPRDAKERLLGQRGRVVWLYGLSGSGKSTLATALAARLHTEGRFAQVLDGDNVRTGLNSDLGFSDEERRENIRRIAEVSRLFAHSGIVTIDSFITPKKNLRRLARDIVGEEDFLEVWVKCSYEACRQRDVKGLYARAEAGEVKRFTGRDSGFEPPETTPDLVIDTEVTGLEESLRSLYELVTARTRLEGDGAKG